MSVPNTSNAQALKRFRQALAATGGSRMTWWAMGDSLTEGHRVSTIDKTWVQLVTRALQKYHVPAGKGGYGYLSNYNRASLGAAGTFNMNGIGSGTNHFAPSGAGVGTPATGSLVGQRAYLYATDETDTITFVGTSATVHFKQGTGQVSFTASVDGGGAVTIPAGSGTVNWRGTWSTGALASTTHTILLTPAAAGKLQVCGVTIFDGDETTGVQQVEMGQNGTTSSNYLAGVATTGNLADAFAIWPNPSLVTIHLATNDVTGAIAAATSLTNIQSIIANIKAGATITPTFVLIAPTARNGTTLAAWAPYTQAIKAVAQADPQNVCVFDLQQQWIDLPTSGNNWLQGLLYTDGVHYLDPGARAFASYLTRFLTGDLAPVT